MVLRGQNWSGVPLVETAGMGALSDTAALGDRGMSVLQRSRWVHDEDARSGYQCAEPVDLADGRILRSALVVLQSSRIAFIWLVEEWPVSVCLLHRMLPGTSQPILAEFRHLGHSVNSHRDIGWLPNAATDGEYNESVLAGFVDEADEQVYAEASHIFRRNLGRHGAALADQQ